MKLLINPVIDSHRDDAIHVPRPGTESQAVEGVHSTLLHVDLGGCSVQFFFFLAQGELHRSSKRSKREHGRDCDGPALEMHPCSVGIGTPLDYEPGAGKKLLNRGSIA